MTSRELSCIRVSSPGDLVEAVPYLLGFHPAESLVVIGFRTPDPVAPVQRVTVAARADLGRDGLEPLTTVPLIDALRNSGTDAAVAILMTAEVDGDPRTDQRLTAASENLTVLFERAELRLLDTLVATDARWWSMVCDKPECCPPQGSLRSETTSLVAAEATYAGLVALPDRQSMVAALDGDSEERRSPLEPALQRAERRLSEAIAGDGAARVHRREVNALIKAAQECHYGTRLTRRRVLRCGAALRDIEIRDAIWLAIDNRSLEPARLMSQLHSQLPRPWDAAPMFLFGWQQWRDGNGTLATIAGERALTSDPAYSAASLLIDAVQAGLDPHSTPPLTSIEGRSA
jgi:hypothetical protein